MLAVLGTLLTASLPTITAQAPVGPAKALNPNLAYATAYIDLLPNRTYLNFSALTPDALLTFLNPNETRFSNPYANTLNNQDIPPPDPYFNQHQFYPRINITQVIENPASLVVNLTSNSNFSAGATYTANLPGQTLAYNTFTFTGQ